jgi:hypothetical protein
MPGSRVKTLQAAKTVSPSALARIPARTPYACATAPPSRWPSGKGPVVASASTLMALPRNSSGTRSCIAVEDDASDQTQNTPPTASDAPDKSGQREQP